MTTFPDLVGFEAHYPDAWAIVPHTLANHTLFTLDALCGLAERFPAGDVEYNQGDLPIGIPFEAVPGNGLSIADTIRGIENNGSWMALKHIERDSRYGDLLRETLAELEPALARTTGPMLNQEAFIFISSPGAVTPLHFDPEYNILLQLRGSKTITVFSATDEEIAPDAAHEAFFTGNQHRNLPWHAAYAARGRQVHVNPGDGIYLPLMAPHWVQNGPEVSISFSVTWRSLTSFREAEAHGMNALLRKAGFSPRAAKRWPAKNTAKSFGYRIARRFGIAGR